MLLFIGCSDNIVTEPELPTLDIYCLTPPTELDKNGYYHYTYIGSNYGSIYFNTEPSTLIHWYSPDEFCVWWFNEYICDPVINYSTYSRDDGTGQQNFYINETFIGDTLTLTGYIDEDVYDTIDIIIK
tara:strand:- start:410 stop:793 length:384 start_codon:yes stop_codon:yes gene_type:complete